MGSKAGIDAKINETYLPVLSDALELGWQLPLSAKSVRQGGMLADRSRHIDAVKWPGGILGRMTCKGDGLC